MELERAVTVSLEDSSSLLSFLFIRKVMLPAKCCWKGRTALGFDWGNNRSS